MNRWCTTSAPSCTGYADALALFGEHGVVDLMGINGYYTFLAMVMNAAQTEAQASSAAPLPD